MSMRALTCVALLIAAVASAHAETGNVVASDAGSRYGGYYTPNVVMIPAGTDLLFAQLDPLALHDIVSFDTDERGAPLFSNERLLQFGERAVVRGVTMLEPGGPYLFSCSLHEWMVGELFVVDAS